MRNPLIGFAVLAAGCSAAFGDPYWVSYEGNDLPENNGWNRVWGDHYGIYHGSGADRSIQDGTLLTNSLYDSTVYDYYETGHSGAFDPGPGELFVAQWRLNVIESPGLHPYDQGLEIVGSNRAAVGFLFSTDGLQSSFEHVTIPYEPSAWHTFVFVSSDMLQYTLSIDGATVRKGFFLTDSVQQSLVNFGDSAQGAASVAQWDFVRFGVVSEPSGLGAALALMFFASATGATSRTWTKGRSVQCVSVLC